MATFNLGKCRLCLKLGEFYSIFTMDNSMQLADMVMECARVKVHEGDGLPDKICSECIQKLSSAFIFKQQCERSDQELRQTIKPPPGFTVNPSVKRQSSDSAFSNHTDTSNHIKLAEKVTPPSTARKRTNISIDNDSVKSQLSFQNKQSHFVEQTPKHKIKRRRKSRYDNDDSEKESEEWYSNSTLSEKSFANEWKCELCPKSFGTEFSLRAHKTWHSRAKDKFGVNVVVDIPKANVGKVEENDREHSCDKCGKRFKLTIMLNRHRETCSTQDNAAPADDKPQLANPDKKYNCQMCPTMFKTVENLRKHMNVCHAAVLKTNIDRKISEPTKASKPTFPCVYCKEPYNEYYEHVRHVSKMCPEMTSTAILECPMCNKTYQKSQYVSHLSVHFRQTPRKDVSSQREVPSCEICGKQLPTQEQLISHLAAHVANVNEDEMNEDAKSRMSSAQGSSSSTPKPGPYNCEYCGKTMKYYKSYLTHVKTHSPVHENENDDTQSDYQYDASMDGDDYESDKQQELERDTADRPGPDDHDGGNGTSRSSAAHANGTPQIDESNRKPCDVQLRDCAAECLLCKQQMRVALVSVHRCPCAGRRRRLRYSCGACHRRFLSCKALAQHVAREPEPEQPVLDMADFVEVLVTKTEPPDAPSDAAHYPDVPITMQPTVDLSGFTCHICNKKMPTLISLKRHVNWHSNVGNKHEQILECFICNETFRFRSHYKLHMRAHYHDTTLDVKYRTCHICERVSKHLRAAQAHMNFHKQTRFQSRDYECALCKRVFQERRVYLGHMAVHYKRGEASGAAPSGEAGPLSCPHCGKVCESEAGLKHHVAWHGSKTALYGARHSCSLCAQQFTNKRARDLHIRSHYEDDAGPYHCPVCGKGYSDQGYLKRHVQAHNLDHAAHRRRLAQLRAGKAPCPVCGRLYPNAARLIGHLRRAHPAHKMVKKEPATAAAAAAAPNTKAHACTLCAQVFPSERRLRMHEERHSRKMHWFKCKFCGHSSLSLKAHNLHIRAHLYRKSAGVKCTHCDASFPRALALTHHLREQHGITETWVADEAADGAAPLGQLQCALCRKQLATPATYARHLQWHTSLRCNYCGEHFSAPQFLHGHEEYACVKRRLLGPTEPHARRLQCPDCHKPFHVQVKLDCHRRTQHGLSSARQKQAAPSAAVCDFCFREFEDADALASHRVYHRSVGYYGCRYCERKFNSITNYNKHKVRHLQTLNPAAPIKCDHCDDTFVAFRDMITHMRDAHDDTSEWLIPPKEAREETCPLCNKDLPNLPRHLQYHEQNRCRHCGRYFTARSAFDAHVCDLAPPPAAADTKAAPDAPYEECDFCFKPLSRSNSRLKHEQNHRASGTILCRLCPRKFKTMDAFREHAFSHRSSKWRVRRLRCMHCELRFERYSAWLHHVRSHGVRPVLHFRATVLPAPCRVCRAEHPNLHNHYRAHLALRCAPCRKYFTSSRVFDAHRCGEPDADPDKVFTTDLDVAQLIREYEPQDTGDGERYYDDGPAKDAGDAAACADQPPAEAGDTGHAMGDGQELVISEVQSLQPAPDVVDLVDDDSLDAGAHLATVVVDSD